MYESLSSSVYVRGGVVEQELRGGKLSAVGWGAPAESGAVAGEGV